MIKTTTLRVKSIENEEILMITFLVPIPDEEKILSLIFIFTLSCGASKGFIKALNGFLKPSEAPQRSEKIIF